MLQTHLTRPELSTNIKGKTVVVTGGVAGIGARVAHAFAKAGATQIAILGRTEKTLQANKEAIEADFPGVKVIYVIADIVDKTAVASAFTSITAQLGKIDICVNNAGYIPAVSAIKDADADDWWRGYEVNVRGSFNVVQAFLPAVSNHPYLIHVTTGAAILPPIPGFSSYATTKIIGVKLFEYVLAENPHVHAVSVHPGGVMTDMGHKAKDAGFEIPQDDSEFFQLPYVAGP
jgi:NAD(P)-dependent dehydrogenase (short-subunit alcohol dehydrogenase family)